MEQNVVTRRIVISGALGAVAVLLGATRWGFIPWFAGASLTIMHVPAVIGAVLEGPVVGAAIGLLFGLFSLIQAAVAPNGPADLVFVNPLISVLPRLLIGPVAWLTFTGLSRFNKPAALIASGIAGSLTNTILVLFMIGAFGIYPWPVLAGVAVTNGLPEAVAGAVLTYAVTAAWMGIAKRNRKIEL